MTITLADVRTRLASEAARLEVAAGIARQEAEYADGHTGYQTALAEAQTAAGHAASLRRAITVLEHLEAGR